MTRLLRNCIVLVLVAAKQRRICGRRRYGSKRMLVDSYMSAAVKELYK